MTDIILKLNDIVADRKLNPDSESYTCKLLDAGENKLVKKLGEENAEFIRAFLVQDDKDVVAEAADYIYHLIVALRYKDIDFKYVMAELENRHLAKKEEK